MSNVWQTGYQKFSEAFSTMRVMESPPTIFQDVTSVWCAVRDRKWRKICTASGHLASNICMRPSVSCAYAITKVVLVIWELIAAWHNPRVALFGVMVGCLVCQVAQKKSWKPIVLSVGLNLLFPAIAGRAAGLGARMISAVFGRHTSNVALAS